MGSNPTHSSSSFFLGKRAVLGIVDLFVVPLPLFLVVDTHMVYAVCTIELLTIPNGWKIGEYNEQFDWV